LNVKEVDVTPCQLRTMLGHTAEKYSSLVVNEYTWTAFARYADEMTAKNCPKGLDLPANPPPTYLVFSSGIGALWNKTEQYFEKLLQKHQLISGWHLNTLVFSSNDVKRSTCEDENQCSYRSNNNEDIPTDTGIPRFATEMVEKYKIGCLVDFEDRITGYYYGSGDEGEKSKVGCKSLWEISTVIIWQFSMRLEEDTSQKLNFRFEEGHIKYNLLRILSERESFLQENPDKEVILQISIPNYDERFENDKRYWYSSNEADNLCRGMWAKELHDFYKGIQTWAGIHGVKVILSPAYDTQERTKGLWFPPMMENGEPSKLSIDDCFGQSSSSRYH